MMTWLQQAEKLLRRQEKGRDMSPSLKRWLMTAVPSLMEAESAEVEEEFSEPPIPLTENYPFQYKKDVVVRGREMRFRPIRSDDADLMIALFNTFSEDTIYHRFFTKIKMTPDRVKRFTNIDYRRQMAIVAVDRDEEGNRRLLGVARYAESHVKEEWAEMALVVGDPWHKQGIGAALLNYLLEVAKNEGLDGLYGLVHYDNRPIFKIFERLKYPTKKTDTGTEIRYDVTLKE